MRIILFADELRRHLGHVSVARRLAGVEAEGKSITVWHTTSPLAVGFAEFNPYGSTAAAAVAPNLKPAMLASCPKVAASRSAQPKH